MAILDMLVAALAAAGTVPAQEFNMADQADLCTSDPAAVVRPEAGGVTANYVFRLETTLTPPVDMFFDGLDHARFAVGAGVQTPNFSLVFVQTRIPARDAGQVREEVEILCGFAKVATGRMALFERYDAKDRARMERERAKQDLEREEKAAATRERATQELAEKMGSMPSWEEVAALLRTPDMLHQFFDDTDPGLKLGQIRELKCTRLRRGTWSCRIGLPIYQRGEPQYAEFEAEFDRDGGGQLIPYDPPIMVN